MNEMSKENEVVKTSLTETEQAEAQKHEKIVDKGLSGYVAIGTALGTLHDERLFVGPFRAYVEERFDLPYHTANRRIVAARVALNIKAAGLLVPFVEDQAYQLHELTPENQVKTWQEVCNRSKQTGVRITTNLIRDTLGKKPQPKSSPTATDESVATVPEMAEEAPTHDGSVVVALQAVGKALAHLQIAFRAVENAEIAGMGEAEHLDAQLNEVMALVSGIRERLPVKTGEPLKLVG